jgi:GH43 family beta-xylosidase
MIYRLFLFLIILNVVFACDQSSNEPSSNGSDDIVEIPKDENTFVNPLLSSGADPWVIKGNGSYYYTHTTGNNLRLWETEHMEDLVNANSKTIWTPTAGEEYSTQIWAPELHYVDGAWYMYFAATSNNSDENRRMFVLENTAESPMEGEWEIKGKIADETDQWAIDGTVLQIDEEYYFVWSGWRAENPEVNSGRQQLYIAKMENPWTLEGSRVMISEPDYVWEQNGLVNEGPVAWENPEGDMFIFYSGSGCWTDDYKIGVLTYNGGDPLDSDSWEKHEEPVFKKSEINSVYGPGHNSFFKSPDGSEDWILYHANDHSGDGCTDSRKPRIQQIKWDENGFPDFGTPVNRNDQLTTPST